MPPYSKEQSAKKPPKPVKKKKPREKKPKISTLAKELWTWTSLAVRLRDADDMGHCKCSTCGCIKYYYAQGIQAGHFVRKSRRGSTEYMLENIHSQCEACNLKDEQYLMGLYINTKYGPGFADQLILENKKPHKKSADYYLQTIEEYKKLVFQYAKEKSLWDWKANIPKKHLKELEV